MAGLFNMKWKWKPGADIKIQLLLFWLGEAESYMKTFSLLWVRGKNDER